MAAEGGVAEATGHVARRESHSPAPARPQLAPFSRMFFVRPLLADAVAYSPATAPWALGGRPRRGARRRGESRRRAPWRPGDHV
eukprot:scaffold74060_cov36-Tisochrysis_lutea.AAC.3